MSIVSKNEWDPLKKVIVGTATDARIPEMDLSLKVINYADNNSSRVPKAGLYPQQVIDEANEDLEIFCNFLKNQGVEVLRPDSTHVPGYYNYCPRDSVLVHDNLILATPQPLRARQGEYLAMEQHFLKLQKAGAKYIVAQAKRTDDLYNQTCLGDQNVLALTDIEPAFDAANVLRDNDNLYYLVSNGGNRAGAAYLQELVGSSKKVWTVENIYSFMHIDSTIALLREGLMLLNPSRIKDVKQLPKPLQSWDVIWAPDPGQINHYPGYCNSSSWLNVNLFSINPNLVALLDGQYDLRRQLESHKIECAMLPGRHQRTLGGGFHCVTLDLERSA
jgi:N-dimethylarginine dimethylaminohydrolase